MSEEQIKSAEELNQTPVETIDTQEKFAKSGKKSKKHLEEVKAEEERKARAEEHKQEALEEVPSQSLVQFLNAVVKNTKPLTRISTRPRPTASPMLSSLPSKPTQLNLTLPSKFTLVSVSIHAKLTKTFVPPSFYQTVMVRLFVSPSSLQKMNARKLRLPVLTSLKIPNSSSNLKRELSISTFSFLPQLTCQNLVSSLACSVLKA